MAARNFFFFFFCQTLNTSSDRWLSQRDQPLDESLPETYPTQLTLERMVPAICTVFPMYSLTKSENPTIKDPLLKDNIIHLVKNKKERKKERKSQLS